ncbi:hypothetical protein [Paenibacillus sp. FSL R7-0652]|uniref:Peptidase M48 domain-containing protein n=1 Tax=Paenibacillus sp. AN1007 TaxID=3151385 RepID=A0AAU8NG45_9BACL
MENNNIFFEILSGSTEFALFNLAENSTDHLIAFNYYKEYAERFWNTHTQNVKFYFPLDFSYKQNFTINGSVQLYDERAIIRINEGVLLKLYKTFYSILSIDNLIDTLSETDDGSLHIKNIYTFNDTFPEYEYTFLLPINKERKIIAEIMAMFAIKFVILHEIAHHFDGHVLYMKTYFNDETLNIVRKANEERILDKQTLEMDADAFAISQLIDEMIDFINNDTLYSNHIKNPSNFCFILFISIHILFLILNDEYELKNSTYSPELVRSLTVLDAAKVNLSYKASEIISKTEILDIIKTSIIKANSLYNSVYGKIDFSSLVNYDESHLKSLHENWKKMRVVLSPYAIAQLAY